MAVQQTSPAPVPTGFRLPDFLSQAGALLLPLVWGWAAREWLGARPAGFAGAPWWWFPAALLVAPALVAITCGMLSGRRRIGIIAGVLTAVVTAAALKQALGAEEIGARLSVLLYPVIGGLAGASLAWSGARIRTRWLSGRRSVESAERE